MTLQQIRERVANAPKSKPFHTRNQLDFSHQEGNSYSPEREAEIQRLLAVQAERDRLAAIEQQQNTAIAHQMNKPVYSVLATLRNTLR